VWGSATLPLGGSLGTSYHYRLQKLLSNLFQHVYVLGARYHKSKSMVERKKECKYSQSCVVWILFSWVWVGNCFSCMATVCSIYSKLIVGSVELFAFEICSYNVGLQITCVHVNKVFIFHPTSYDSVKEIADYLLGITDVRPKIGIICGSGLGDLVNQVENAEEFEYSNIPKFPVSTGEWDTAQYTVILVEATCVCAYVRVSVCAVC